MADDFVHLHVHTEYSLLDGMGRVSQLTKRAAELGQPALALTDHGTMHGAIEFTRACKAAGIRPLLGVEAYLTQHGRPMEGRDSELDKNRHHLLLLAQDMTGYHNLLQICSDAQLKGFYHRPRIDADYLAAHSAGLICTSGCLTAELPALLRAGKEEKALERLHWYREVFGPDRWYIEFQEHDIPELTQINHQLFDFARRFDVPMIVTNDVHYVKEQDAKPHDVLLCVQTGALISDEKRLRYDGTSYFLKTLDQMRQTFRPLADLPDSAFTNTLKIAEMVDVDPEDSTYHLPDIAIPDGYDYRTYLRHLTEEGLRRRYGGRADDPDVQARKEHELKIIHDMGFDVYYLIVWDLCMYAQRRGIWWNVRGSGAGSIVAYAIGVTNLDPLRNKLIFERFLNPGRVTMPDFDLDFPDDQREELIRYTVDKFGNHRVAQIVTFGRMKARAAVRDIGRALDISLPEVDALAKMIPGIPGKPVTIADVLTPEHEFYSVDLKNRYESDDRVHQLLDLAKDVEGVARHSSIHAAAVIVADRELTYYTPLMRPPKSAITETVTQYEYPILESIGLLKVDFLGLATLTLMREATNLIRERHGVGYTLDNLPIDDPQTYELLTSGDVLGVFQVEGQGMRRVLMDLRPTEFDHITATISLYRPGPMEFIPDFIACLHGEKQPQYVHPILASILAETMGVCVYQEQVIQILADIAGYTPGEADLVRRGISKKSKKTLDEHREIFARGSHRVSKLSRAEADAIWDALMGFARYGFNRAHAADYAVIVAQTGYLKAHYPVEYMAALLTVERHNTEKIGMLIAECRRMGIEVLPPSVNVSGHRFSVEKLPPDRTAPRRTTTYPFPIEPGVAIRMGLDAIKNLGEGAVDLVLAARGETPFASLTDFTERVDLRELNRRGLECLIKVGALDDFGPRGRLMAAIDAILGASAGAHLAAEAGQMSLFGGTDTPGEGAWTGDDILASVAGGIQVSPKEILEWEKELVGVYVSSHPLQQMTVDLQNVITHATVDITEELRGTFIIVAGLIADVRTITTKKGDTMAFIKLEDLQGSVDLTVFPQLFKEKRHLWSNEKIVIVWGKADFRNGRVNVVVDKVQDYVEGMKIIEDTTSVHHRYRNGQNTPDRPTVRNGVPSAGSAPAGKPAAPRIPPPQAHVAGAYVAGTSSGEEDDDALYGDANPFAGDEPDWLEESEAPAFRAAAPAIPAALPVTSTPAASSVQTEPAEQNRAALALGTVAAPVSAAQPEADVPPESQAADARPRFGEPVAESQEPEAVSQPPDDDKVNGHEQITSEGEFPNASPQTGPSLLTLPAEPPAVLPVTPPLAAAVRAIGLSSAATPATVAAAARLLRLTFRRSHSLDADRRRLSELVDLLEKYEGDDRFEIVIEAQGNARYQLAFPNHHTRICRPLQNELSQRLGAGAWAILTG